MQKVRSELRITKRKNGYYAKTTCILCNGYSEVYAGKNPEEAALFTMWEKLRYLDKLPRGINIFAPAEIRELIDAAHIRQRE